MHAEVSRRTLSGSALFRLQICTVSSTFGFRHEGSAFNVSSGCAPAADSISLGARCGLCAVRSVGTVGGFTSFHLPICSVFYGVRLSTLKSRHSAWRDDVRVQCSCFAVCLLWLLGTDVSISEIGPVYAQ
ncbi:hypothetical protein CBR_g51108 [Chara braunii]|uniref:Uncharacterized protein n=1 Tax=Chara braunii TaxID=69332 RepID=A0A388K6E1_CHABU|nr:hypothetical protein CBR_g51108 [Chara braunii]|eukprot:GBG65513.1 hypothetical protein CBR_g51108 [Chara braunii]